jgi:hypothetical protein
VTDAGTAVFFHTVYSHVCCIAGTQNTGMEAPGRETLRREAPRRDASRLYGIAFLQKKKNKPRGLSLFLMVSD